MQKITTASVSIASGSSVDILSDILRQGAQRMLAEAIEAEVAEWIDQTAHLVDAQGRRQVVRNGRKRPS
jgi:putative transposase